MLFYVVIFLEKDLQSGFCNVLQAVRECVVQCRTFAGSHDKYLAAYWTSTSQTPGGPVSHEMEEMLYQSVFHVITCQSLNIFIKCSI